MVVGRHRGMSSHAGARMTMLTLSARYSAEAGEPSTPSDLPLTLQMGIAGKQQTVQI